MASLNCSHLAEIDRLPTSHCACIRQCSDQAGLQRTSAMPTMPSIVFSRAGTSQAMQQGCWHCCLSILSLWPNTKSSQYFATASELQTVMTDCSLDCYELSCLSTLPRAMTALLLAMLPRPGLKQTPVSAFASQSCSLLLLF